MTLLTMARKNVRHELRRYAAFFLSAAFAVWMFFLYASLLAHPVMSSEQMNVGFRDVLVVVAWIVAVFAVLFILYAQSGFFKVRQRELAIYTMLGMLPGQIGRVIHYENLVVGVGATTAGVAIGAVSLKLFYLAIGWVMGLPSPLPFHFSWSALALTYVIFLGVFTAISAWAFFRLGRLPLAEQIRGAARPKAPPRFSWWKVALCAVSTGAAYVLALTANPGTIAGRFPVIMAMLLIGTALLFSQGSVALIQALKRRPLYWRRTNLLTVSQLAYKVRDNAWVLFMVSVLTMLVLAVGSVYYAAYDMAAKAAEEWQPVHLVLKGDHGPVNAAHVAEVLAAHGIQPVREGHLPVLSGFSLQWGPKGARHVVSDMAVASESQYRKWVRDLTGDAFPDVPNGHGFRMEAFRDTPPGTAVGIGPGFDSMKSGPPEPWTAVTIDAAPEHLRERKELYAGRSVLVVDDALFEQLLSHAGEPERVTLHAYFVPDWKRLGPVVEELKAALMAAEPDLAVVVSRDDWQSPIRGTWTRFSSRKREVAEFLFVFGFIALLFFLASGNMLYFKLFNDLHDDRRQFEALHKVGLGPGEVGRILSVQVVLLFFAPFIVAVVHAATALYVMAALSGAAALYLWRVIGVVSAVYLLLQGGYFLVARRSYVRAVLGGN